MSIKFYILIFISFIALNFAVAQDAKNIVYVEQVGNVNILEAEQIAYGNLEQLGVDNINQAIIQQAGNENYVSIKQSGESKVKVSQLSRAGKNNLNVLQEGMMYAKINQNVELDGQVSVTQVNGRNNYVNIEISGTSTKLDILQVGSNNYADQYFIVDRVDASISQHGNNNKVQQKASLTGGSIELVTDQIGENNLASQDIKFAADCKLIILQNGNNNSAVQNINQSFGKVSTSIIGQIGNNNNAIIK
jgi:hypothetical protein